MYVIISYIQQLSESILPESDSDESEEGGHLVGVNLSVCSSMVCSDSLSALALEITIH